MAANMIQAIGSIMNLRWVTKRGLSDGIYCAMQGHLRDFIIVNQRKLKYMFKTQAN